MYYVYKYIRVCVYICIILPIRAYFLSLLIIQPSVAAAADGWRASPRDPVLTHVHTHIHTAAAKEPVPDSLFPHRDEYTPIERDREVTARRYLHREHPIFFLLLSSPFPSRGVALRLTFSLSLSRAPPLPCVYLCVYVYIAHTTSPPPLRPANTYTRNGHAQAPATRYDSK